MGSYTSGMEDEQISVNVADKEMRGFLTGLDPDVLGDLSEGVIDGEGIRDTDFASRERKVIKASDVLGSRKCRSEVGGSEDSSDRDTNRKPSAVDILRRNLGVPVPLANINNNSSDDQRDRVGSVVGVVLQRGTDSGDRGRSPGRENQARRVAGEEPGKAEDTPGFASPDPDEVGLARSEGHGLQGGHVYCTVYCVESGDCWGPPESLGARLSLGGGRTTPPVEPGVPAQLERDRPPQMDPEPDPRRSAAEPFTVSGVIDSRTSADPHAGDRGLSVVLTCRICLDDKHIEPLSCCRRAVCGDCLQRYLSSQVHLGRVGITCPITECSEHLEDSTVLAHLPGEDIAKYMYFLELSRVDSSTKPCPQCNHFTSLKSKTPSKSESRYKVQCPKCQFVWCFRCHAPWHDGLNCKDYRKGDKLLRHWASAIEHGQRNAQKCPRCKIHIQRTEGCDHMTCSQCNTNFCYRCGEKYRHLRFFGDHTSNLSVFGCKYRYLPEKPHLRRLIRGSVCVSKVLVAPVVIVLVVVFGAIALVIGLIAFPIYYICKKQRKRSQGTGRWLC
ncbi:E3 ubiquitin-protein ligase RNF217 isoform X2 [Lepisosteus oculatus]|uniref:E3 ubiquitin-protein ligase RNF217 isoform X2 n=1 Tax=Lepisosteus oculatus TaxID=7918 RepID=UPI0035F5300F